jgi:hypothetical protein
MAKHDATGCESRFRIYLLSGAVASGAGVSGGQDGFSPFAPRSFGRFGAACDSILRRILFRAAGFQGLSQEARHPAIRADISGRMRTSPETPVAVCSPNGSMPSFPG